MPSKLEGIIFDLDNTLVLTEELHFKAIREVTAQFNVNLEWDFFDSEYIGKDATTIWESILAYVNAEITDEKVKVLKELKKEAFQDILAKSKVPTVPGAKEFLEEIKKSGTPMTVATNTGKDTAEMLLYKSGLIDYFKKIVTRDSVKKPKPDPEMFKEAARIMTADIEKCAIFEDSGPGFMAASEAKAFFVGLTTSTHPAEPTLHGANIVIPDYTKINLAGLRKEFDKWEKEKLSKVANV